MTMTEPGRDGQGGPLRVLLVEDVVALRDAFSQLLRLHGFEVREANDGREALDCLVEFLPQVILTDLMMPVMGGLELMGRLRADPRTATIPVVAITADAAEQVARQAREAGAREVIVKPVDLRALLASLRLLDPRTAP